MRDVYQPGLQEQVVNSFKSRRDTHATNNKMPAIQEQQYEAYTEADQTESYYDESDLTSLCDEENEHNPNTLIQRDISKLYDKRKPYQVFR